MTKMNLTTLLLLSTAIVSLSTFPAAAEAETKDFNWLKQQLESATQEKEQDIELSEDIVFSDKTPLTVGKDKEPKNVKIVVKGDGKSLKGHETSESGSTTKTNTEAFTVKKGSRLTLKNVNITDFDGDSSYIWEGAIQNYGTVVLEADQNEKVEFKNNSNSKRRGVGGDITMIGGELYILGKGGTISFSSGITGSDSTGKIYHGCDGTNPNSEICKDAEPNTSKLVLGGNSGGFRGSFTNYSGDVDVQSGATFFGGNSTFKSGKLTWLTTQGRSGTLNLDDGTTLVVGEEKATKDQETPSKGSLTLGANDTLGSNVDITINDGSTLTLSGKTDKKAQTLNKQVKGSGTLNLANTQLTLNGSTGAESSGDDQHGLSENLKVKASSNSTLTLKNLKESAGNTLKALVASLTSSGDVASNGISGLHLVMHGYDVGDAENTDNKLTLTVDGSHITDLLLETGENVKENKLKDVTIQNSGKMDNKATTTVGKLKNSGTVENSGNLTITGLDEEYPTDKSALDNSGTLTNAHSGTLTVKKDVKNSGTLKNEGTFKAEGEVVNNEEKKGKIENSGTFTFSKVTNDGEITNSGTFGSLDGSVEVDNNGDIINSGNGSFKATIFNNNNKTKFTGSDTSSIEVDTLKNNGEIDVSSSTGTFKVKKFTNGESNDYTEAKIKGQNLEVEVWQNNWGNIELSGNLTVNDPSTEKPSASNPVENNGTIQVQNLTVHNVKIDNKKDHEIKISGKAHTAEINNQGKFEITGELDAHGNVTNGNGETGEEKGASLTFAGGKIEGNLTNNGTVTVNNGSTTVTGNVTNSGSITTNGTTTVSGTTTSNNGKWENKGDLTFAGAVSGTGSFTNSGNLTLTGSGSEFTGSFTQSGGKTTAHNGMFKGTNTVNGGELDVTGEKLDYKVTLGSNAKWKHTTTGKEVDNIDENTLKFEEGATGAEAFFTGSGIGSGGYTLKSAVTSENNSITFENATLKLKDGTDFKNLKLHNTGLDLRDGESKDYTFSKFSDQGNNSLYFDADLQNGNTFKSDTLKFSDSGNVTWDLGGVKINDEKFSSTESFTGTVLTDGASFKEKDLTVYSSKFSYNVKANGQTVTIQKGDAVGPDPLNDANDLEGNRSIQLSGNTGISGEDNTYHTLKSLDKMKKGEFSVSGDTNTLLSGKLWDNTGEGHPKLKEEYGSFFDIDGSDDITFDLRNLTIKDAQRKVTAENEKGGSVFRNSGNSNAKVTMSGLTIQGNSSKAGDTGGSSEVRGGAIYNNGGEGILPSSDDFTGLYLSQVTFKDNTAGEGGKGKGGAIYNDENGFLYLEGVTLENGGSGTELAEGKNDLYNAGTMYTNGTNKFESLVTNEGVANFQGEENTLKKFVNKNTAEFSGTHDVVEELDNEGKGSEGVEDSKDATLTNRGNLTLKTVKNDGHIENESGTLTFAGEAESGSTVTGKGTVTNKGGTVIVASDVSGMTGGFTQDGGSTEVNAKFFGGTTTVNNGLFSWNEGAERADNSKFDVKGETGTLFALAENQSFTLNSGDSIASMVSLGNGSSMTVNSSGKLSIYDNSIWAGTITVNGGEFTLNTTLATQPSSGGILKAETGSVTLGAGSKLHLGNGSEIKDAVKTEIGDDAIVLISEGGEMSLNDGDTTKGHTLLDGGTLKFGEKVKVEGEHASLEASRGNLNILKGATLDLVSENSFIDDPVALNIEKDATLKLSLGSIMISDEDKWDGNINLAGGNLYYATTTNGNLTATSGNLTLLDGSLMTIGTGSESTIEQAVNLDIRQGSTLKIDDSAKFTLDSQDQWHGTIQNEGGQVTFSGLTGIGGKFEQTEEKSSVTFKDKTDLWLNGDNFHVEGGLVALDDSRLRFYNTTDMGFAKLKMSNGSTLGFKNGAPQKVTVDELTLDGSVSHFTFDVDFSGGQSDQVALGTVNGSGTLDVSEFGIVGSVPNDKSVDVELFTGENLDDLTFSASADRVRSALGYYDLTALEDKKGWYRATLLGYNPNAHRGQVSSIALMQNQLGVDDMVLHHLILDHAGTVPHESSVAKTRRVNQALKEGRGANVWVKPYYDGGKLSLSEGLDVDNNSYGLIAGADMPMGTFDNGWQYVPTFYVAYNGADQSYEDVDMNQNGGQAGFMTTFMKNNFVAAANVYGGAYENEMEVENVKDKTDGWFAGVSARAAYNAKLNANLTLQPALFASYNMFSKQDWDSDFGHIAMETDALNGYNVAPELNLIYTQNDWSVYGMLQYMFTFDQDVQAKADETDLPDIGMDGDYVQYGAGVAKIWNKALSTNFQIIGRSGSRTDVGVRLGVQYMFN